MKHNSFLIALALCAVIPLQGMQKKVSTSVESPAERVENEVSLLDQIVKQAGKVIRAGNDRVRVKAKKDLKALMARKDLDEKIKKEIEGDVATILKTTYKTIKASQDAFDHLLDVVAGIDAQANVVAVTQEATEMVQNAPDDEKLGMMQLAYQKIQEATQAARDMASRAYVGAKSIVARPVNYVFGEEESDAKTAFYAKAGTLALAAGAYGAYKYGYSHGKELSPDIIEILRHSAAVEKDELGKAFDAWLKIGGPKLLEQGQLNEKASEVAQRFWIATWRLAGLESLLSGE